MGNNIRLLCTAPLEQKIMNNAERAGVSINVVPFIKSSVIDIEELREDIGRLCNRQLTVVFTSANAIEAIGEYIIQAATEWKIYCIGYATKNTALTYFKEEDIHGTAKDAAELAGEIIKAKVNDVIFFCGDKRLNTLPVLLCNAGIEVKEIIVYKTEATPYKVSSAYDGILFFSPSAAESFFSVNSIQDDIVLFAIGNTTANVIKNHCSNLVVAGENPTKQILVQDAINYFHTHDK